jgi:hypothetical protein
MKCEWLPLQIFCIYCNLAFELLLNEVKTMLG